MSLLRPPSCRLPIRSAQRTFSTTTSRPVSLQLERNDPEAVADTVPAYPHGPARWYKQSNKGLYGGQRIQFGNNVSGKFDTKTRRTFQVNVLTKRLWSHALDRFVQVRVTARTLRTIDHVGGLDEYLLSDNALRIKQLGVSGWWLRWAIMQQPAVKARFSKERYDLGLGPREEYESMLKALELGNVGADLEEAYAALPDESDVQITTPPPMPEVEEIPVGAEAPPGEINIAPLPNHIIQVTSAPDQQPLKFRVDRRTHVMLGPNGWVQTRPSSPEYSKQKIAKERYPNYVATRMAKFESELAQMKLADKEMHDMSLQEEKEILKDARRRFTREVESMADRVWEDIKMKRLEEQARARRVKALAEETSKKEARRLVREERRGSPREMDAFDLAAAPANNTPQMAA